MKFSVLEAGYEDILVIAAIEAVKLTLTFLFRARHSSQSIRYSLKKIIDR